MGENDRDDDPVPAPDDGEERQGREATDEIDPSEAIEGADATDEGAPAVENPFADDPVGGAADAEDGNRPDDADDAPFSRLAAAVDERRRADRGEEPSADDLFESVDVERVDVEALWASLSATDDSDPLGPGGVGTATDSRPGDSSAGPDTRREDVLDKRQYCQRCRFLSEPPAVACEHEGTDIVAVVDSRHFRVCGCPMVSEDGSPDFAAVGDEDGDEHGDDEADEDGDGDDEE